MNLWGKVSNPSITALIFSVHNNNNNNDSSGNNKAF